MKMGIRRFSAIVCSFALVGLIAAAGQASAAFITGSINFSGIGSVAWTPVDGTNTPTTIASSTGVDVTSDQALVTGSSGDLSGIAIGTVATYNDFQFDNSTFSAVTPLWTVGGFSFDLESITSVTKSANGIVVTGTGTLSAAGFDDTTGTWSFSGDQTGSSTFAFSSTTQAAVPEPASLLLLGSGLGGLALAGRRKKKA